MAFEANFELEERTLVEATFELNVLAKGDKGDKGDTGATGPQGIQGIQGIPGQDATPYTLPTASSLVKGGVKIGSGLTMTGEVLSADAQPQLQSNYTQTDNTQPDYIKNKPDLTVYATNTALGDKVDKVTGKSLISDTEISRLAGVSNVDISGKVDKVTGKGLSTNDLTDTLKSTYDSAVANSHTHSNKSILDNTTASFTDSSYVHTDNNFTSALKSNYDTASTNSHTHSNKSVLDNTTASFTTAQATNLGNQSGTNTGDETASTIKSKLGITTLSGNNTGDQDLSGLVTKTTTVNGHALSSNITVTATDTGAPTISSGTTAPSSTPAKVGDIYIDYTNKYVYKAMGTSSSSDWVKQSKFSETAVVATGTSAPSTTPAKVGDLYIDTQNVKFYRANGTSSSSDWKLTNGTYTLQTAAASSSSTGLSNATAYYQGAVWGSNGLSTSTTPRIYIPRAGTITKFYGALLSGTGSNETSTVYIRVNNTTDYTISTTIDNSTGTYYFNNTSLNIPVSAGDYLLMKWITPTWTTKPTYISLNGVIEIDL